MKKLVIIALLISVVSTSVGQTADQLYAQGYAAYTSYHWKDAMNLLWSYLNYNPRPADLANASFKAQVTSAYNYARSRYLAPPPQRKTASDDDIQASIAGLEQAPPRLRRPRMLQLPPGARIINISGTWILKIYHRDGQMYFCSLDLRQNEKNISGTLSIVSGTDMPVVGTFEGKILTFACVSGQSTQSYTLSTDDFINFTGSFEYQGSSPDFGALTMARKRPGK